MNCPHCGIAFHDRWTEADIPGTDWTALATTCPGCDKKTIRLELRSHTPDEPVPEVHLEFMAYPRTTQRKPTPQEVPDEIKQDYEEACMVLSDSNKASAALSRRCLQAILWSQGYTQRNLARQIEALLGEKDPA